MAIQGILSDPEALTSFATFMITSYGTTDVWKYEKIVYKENNDNPLAADTKSVVLIPLSIAIVAWSDELINNTTILQGDKQGWIAYTDDLENLQVGDYVVKQDSNGQEISRLRIVAPTQPQEYKEKIVAFMVNLRK